MDGNRLRLELFNPPGSTEVPQLRVSSIVHGFRSISGGENNALTASGRSGSCNINVACKDADQWRNQVRSVAMVLTASGTGYCTGAMLNNGAKDGRQLFLTAYHCVGTKDVTDDMLLFNYQFDQCSPQPSQSFPSQKQTTHGLRKVAQWSRSDFALLEVEERIPEDYNVYLSGWTAAMDQVPVDPVGIHHPSADVKKISQMLGNCSHSTWGMRFSSPTEDPLAQQDHWRIQRWSRGTTEPGSSGSPLFDGVTGRVVGQLHGGSAACYNPSGYDAYGKLAYSFHRAGVPSKQMQQALDPHKQGLKSMDGMDLLAARRSASEASKNEQRVFSYRYSNSHVSK
jgi:hypothetical protein